MQHHIYFSPGMFGFARLASFEYFGHLDRALHTRFRDAGHTLETHVSDALPTESVRRRAARLAELVDRTSGDDGPIHLLGHSTGGLDARLVASPSARLPIADGADGALKWLPRLRSVTTMNTPHYGTPLASFFATSKGQRVLYAMSAFTFVGLTLGERPLAAASLLIGILGRGDRAMGLDIRILDKSVDGLLAVVDDARSPDVRTYLNAIKADQGSMLQLSPEAMDMMLAGFEDRPGVAYQSTVAMSPTPSPGNWVGTLGHPWSSISLALFTALHAITARHDKRYPCAAMPQGALDHRPWAGDEIEAALVQAFGASPDLHANDGVVPVRSQIWGKLIWAGLGDHLDVLGHYHDITVEADVALRHHDWLTSGSAFDDAHFDALMDAIATGIIAASAP
jgi:triacylglycerol lipase